MLVLSSTPKNSGVEVKEKSARESIILKCIASVQVDDITIHI
jgi:hypothetical protein